MNVLILSCNTGAGHNSCAKAISQVYETRGHNCQITDALSFVSENLSAFIAWGHSTTYRHAPKLFQKGYDFSERHPNTVQGKVSINTVLATGAGKLREHILQGQFDTVICTHVFSALMLTDMQKKHPIELKTGFVSTDFTYYPGVDAIRMDRYFVPAAALRPLYLDGGIPEEKIVISGIPVAQQHYQRTQKAAAKAQLGIQPEQKHLLMMCGSMGCGPIKETARLLVQQIGEDTVLSIVCGTNKRLHHALAELYGSHSRVRIYGFVKEMSLMMDSADLYLTKPGGLSVSEAAIRDLPMVFINAVAGCEEHNRRYFEELGAAKSSDDPEILAAMCADLLTHPAELEKMKRVLSAEEKINAAEKIYQELCKV